MTIVYRGFDYPSRTGKGRACVWVDSAKRGAERGPHDLPDLLAGASGLDWGTVEVAGGRRLPRPGCDALALALCAGVLDQAEARKIYKLFQHRHVNPMPDGPWTLVEAEVLAWARAIQHDMTEGRRQAARAPVERPQIERDIGVGANGVPVVWDSDDDGKIIPARDPEDMTWTPAPHRRPNT